MSTPTVSPTAIFFTHDEVASTEGDFLIVDYSLSLEKMMKKADFTWCNPNVASKNFPISGSGTETFEFGVVDCSNVPLKYQDCENPWKDASVEHLIALGILFPDLQKKYSIAALASVCIIDDMHQTPYLRQDEVDRDMELHATRSEKNVYVWPKGFRFLKVRRCRPRP